MKNGWRVLAVVCVAVVGAYAYMAESPSWDPTADASDAYYNLLVRGFRAGQLNLKKEVPVALTQLPNPYDGAANQVYQDPPYRMHDLSYYKGKLYLYWGIAPALLLFWPFSVLTGRYLFHHEAVVIFCAIGFLASARVLHDLWRRYFPGVNTMVVAACTVALGFATGVPMLLSWAGVYEVPVACGSMCTMLALAAVWRALHEPVLQKRTGWLVAASTAYGLAVGSRPSLALGAVILLVPVLQSWRERFIARTIHHERRKIGVELVAAGCPIALIGLGLMLYNYRRFEDPFQFGLRYQFGGKPLIGEQLFGLHYLWFNFRVLFLAPAQWSRQFPYVHDIVAPPLPAGHWEVGRPFGVLTNIPVVWLALAAPLAWRGRPAEERSRLRWFIAAAALLFALCALPLGLFCSAMFRYEVDFLPTLMLLAVIGILGVERALAPSAEAGMTDRRTWRRAARWGWGLLLVFSVAFNLLASVEYYAETDNWLGAELLYKGNVAEATEQFQRALRLEPDYPEAHYNLGVAMTRVDMTSEAIQEYEEALRLKPDYADAHNNLGTALAKTGRLPEAIKELERAVQLEPDLADVHCSLGIVLGQVGRTSEAIEQLNQSLRLRPDFAEAHYGLGFVFGLTEKPTEAIAQFEQALRTKPEDPSTQINLAWLLATRAPSEGGDPYRAVTLAEHACAQASNDAYPCLDTLAAAYAAAGRFNEAVATAQKAVNLARAAYQPQVAQAIATRLELYRSGHAYHQPGIPTSTPDH